MRGSSFFALRPESVHAHVSSKVLVQYRRQQRCKQQDQPYGQDNQNDPVSKRSSPTTLACFRDLRYANAAAICLMGDVKVSIDLTP